jgi:hypothetical protein
MKPELFQTPASEKKGFWHIIGREDDRKISPLCNCQGYYFGGYHKDKPKMTKEAVKRVQWDGTQEICPSCIMQAYMSGKITIEFI